MTFTVQLIDCMYLPNTGHLTPHDTGTITMGTLIMQRAPPCLTPQHRVGGYRGMPQQGQIQTTAWATR